MNKSIERQISQLCMKVFKKLYTKKNLASLATGSKKDIVATVNVMNTSKQYDAFAKRFAKELSKKGMRGQKGTWRKNFAIAKKLKHVGLNKSFADYEFEILTNAVKTNFKMIKSIPDEMLKMLEHKYTSLLIEEVVKGSIPRGSFQKELSKHGHKRAGVIARTETAKLQTAINRKSSLELGSVVYEWFSSHDKRTRQSHKDMNGVIVFWRSGFEKPFIDNMYGDAGEFPNCRCNPGAILDESDLTKQEYTVYDYKSKKLIKMTKSELLVCIEAKHL